MGSTLHQLGQVLGLPTQGPDVLIHGAAALEQAGPNDLTFLTQERHLHKLAGSKAGAVVIHPDHAPAVGSALLSRNPHLDFARALTLLTTPQGEFGPHQCQTQAQVQTQAQAQVQTQPQALAQAQAFIHPEAQVHPSVRLHPFV